MVMENYDLNRIPDLEINSSIRPFIKNVRKGELSINKQGLAHCRNNVVRTGQSNEKMVREMKRSLVQGYDYQKGSPMIVRVDIDGNIVQIIDGNTKYEAAVMANISTFPAYYIEYTDDADIDYVSRTIGITANQEKPYETPASDEDYVKDLVVGVNNGYWGKSAKELDDRLMIIANRMSDRRRRDIVGEALIKLGHAVEFEAYTNARIEVMQSDLSVTFDGKYMNNMQISNKGTWGLHKPFEGLDEEWFGANLKPTYEERQFFNSVKRFNKSKGKHKTYLVGHVPDPNSADSIWKKRQNMITKVNDILNELRQGGYRDTPCKFAGFLPQLVNENKNRLITEDEVIMHTSKNSKQGIKTSA